MPEGWGRTDGTFPELAGQHRTVLIKQLTDIREGNRDNPTMYPFALPSEIGGEQSVADVTAYIAKLPMNPENGVGPGTGSRQRREALQGQLRPLPRRQRRRRRREVLSRASRASIMNICCVSISGSRQASGATPIPT